MNDDEDPSTHLHAVAIRIPLSELAHIALDADAMNALHLARLCVRLVPRAKARCSAKPVGSPSSINLHRVGERWELKTSDSEYPLYMARRSGLVMTYAIEWRS